METKELGTQHGAAARAKLEAAAGRVQGVTGQCVQYGKPGHPDRLNRVLSLRFGESAYAVEELIAEIGSAFLCASCGIEGRLQHVSYVANWIQVLKGDKRAVFAAAAKAQQAADYVEGLAKPAPPGPAVLEEAA